MTNPNVGLYEPGRDLTGRASTAVTGKRFLAIVGNRDRGNLAVGHATAAGRVCGVSKYDAAVGAVVGVARGNSRVTFVATPPAGTALAAFAEVEVGANGTAVARTTGIAVGYTVTGTAIGVDAEISLY